MYVYMCMYMIEEGGHVERKRRRYGKGTARSRERRSPATGEGNSVVSCPVAQSTSDVTEYSIPTRGTTPLSALSN